MTDLAIAALSGAGITVTMVILVAVFGLKLSSAKDDREAARVSVARLSGELETMTAERDRLAKDLANEQERSDALDDALFKTSADPDPVGARDRVLQSWTVAHNASRGRTVFVSAPSTAVATGPTGGDVGLLKPGD